MRGTVRPGGRETNETTAPADWLAAATKGIRFRPDREAVEAELRAHIEDKTADLMRIFPSMTGEEARERALAQMGDPEEIGKELAKIHKPWLGYLWRASKWIAITLVVLLMTVNILENDHFQSAGYPLPTSEMEFRRLERQYLLPRSEIVFQTGFWNIGGAEEIKSRAGTYLSVFQTFVVGTIKDQVYAATLYAPGKHMMSVVPLGEGPTPIPINSVIARAPEPGKTWMSGCNILFFQIPGETARAELDVDAVLPGGEKFARYAQDGICLEEGIWLFSMKSPEGGYSSDWYAGASYTLRLYGGGGELMLEREGVLSEPM